ncbi:hypothetical protein Pelo_3679 [Pelomyxa schiedti]|nr:hypothetical protein Pelo_3679 [Pelomyxa schiedti]
MFSVGFCALSGKWDALVAFGVSPVLLGSTIPSNGGKRIELIGTNLQNMVVKRDASQYRLIPTSASMERDVALTEAHLHYGCALNYRWFVWHRNVNFETRVEITPIYMQNGGGDEGLEDEIGCGCGSVAVPATASITIPLSEHSFSCEFCFFFNKLNADELVHSCQYVLGGGSLYVCDVAKTWATNTYTASSTTTFPPDSFCVCYALLLRKRDSSGRMFIIRGTALNQSSLLIFLEETTGKWLKISRSGQEFQLSQLGESQFCVFPTCGNYFEIWECTADNGDASKPLRVCSTHRCADLVAEMGLLFMVAPDYQMDVVDASSGTSVLTLHFKEPVHLRPHYFSFVL